MITFDFVIRDGAGLHARPAGQFVQRAKSYDSRVRIAAGERDCDGKKLMALMSMGLACGDSFTVTVEGHDEKAAAGELRGFLEENL